MFNGNIPAFQAGVAGSSPVARSNYSDMHRSEMAPDTPVREPEMQELSSCVHNPLIWASDEIGRHVGFRFRCFGVRVQIPPRLPNTFAIKMRALAATFLGIDF